MKLLLVILFLLVVCGVAYPQTVETIVGMSISTFNFQDPETFIETTFTVLPGFALSFGVSYTGQAIRWNPIPRGILHELHLLYKVHITLGWFEVEWYHRCNYTLSLDRSWSGSGEERLAVWASF